MNSEKVMDKTESLVDEILKHISIENCLHCKQLVKESFEK